MVVVFYVVQLKKKRFWKALSISLFHEVGDYGSAQFTVLVALTITFVSTPYLFFFLLFIKHGFVFFFFFFSWLYRAL